MREHIVGDRLDVVRTEKGAALRRDSIADLLSVHPKALRRVVGATNKKGHTRAGPAASDRLDDLVPRQFGFAQ